MEMDMYHDGCCRCYNFPLPLAKSPMDISNLCTQGMVVYNILLFPWDDINLAPETHTWWIQWCIVRKMGAIFELRGMWAFFVEILRTDIHRGLKTQVNVASDSRSNGNNKSWRCFEYLNIQFSRYEYTNKMYININLKVYMPLRWDI